MKIYRLILGCIWKFIYETYFILYLAIIHELLAPMDSFCLCNFILDQVKSNFVLLVAFTSREIISNLTIRYLYMSFVSIKMLNRLFFDSFDTVLPFFWFKIISWLSTQISVSIHQAISGLCDAEPVHWIRGACLTHWIHFLIWSSDFWFVVSRLGNSDL